MNNQKIKLEKHEVHGLVQKYVKKTVEFWHSELKYLQDEDAIAGLIGALSGALYAVHLSSRVDKKTAVKLIDETKKLVLWMIKERE